MPKTMEHTSNSNPSLAKPSKPPPAPHHTKRFAPFIWTLSDWITVLLTSKWSRRGTWPTAGKTWIHPWRLTWNIILEVWKIIFLSKWVMCRFHVNLPGGKKSCTCQVFSQELRYNFANHIPWKASEPNTPFLRLTMLLFGSLIRIANISHYQLKVTFHHKYSI